MEKLLATVLFLLLVQYGGYAQIDTEFWFAPPEFTSGHGDLPNFLRISSQDLPTTVIVTRPANGNEHVATITLEANSSHSLNLTYTLPNLETIFPDSVMKTGLKIVSTAPITVYYEQGSSFNAEIFALKGKNALGNRFVIPWQNVFDNSTDYVPTPYAAFDVVATQNNTVVTVIPSGRIAGHETDTVIRVKLNAGETYSFKKPGSRAVDNLVGTIVTSTKPIAISIKDDSVIKETCRDGLGDQLIPATVAGREYIVPRGFLRPPEYIFITAMEDNTDVYASGINVPIIQLNAGQMYRLSHTTPSLYIRSTKNIIVLHLTGFGCEVGMAVLPPINCTGSKRISFTRSTDEFFGMTILSKKEGLFNFKLTRNGQSEYLPANLFVEVAGTNGEWYTGFFTFDVDRVPVAQASTISNDLHSFQAGIIHGNAGTTCRYGYFSSFSTLFIGDDFAICEGNTATIDAGPGKETYLWSTGETTQSIDVAEAGDYWVRVTREDCTLSDTVHMDVRTGHEDLGPDVEICPGGTSNVNGGENFSWLWSDGSTAQYLRTKVLGKHWVNVVDDYGCAASDTIMVNEYSGVIDALADVKLEHVSVDTAKQENINVAWTVIHPEKIPDNSISIYKRILGDSQWELTSSIDGGVQSYTNSGNATSDNSYEFYVALADHCLAEQRVSLIHNSILLSGLADSVNDAINLRWNPYIEWPKGVQKYEVWRKLDQDTVYSFVSFVNGVETKFNSPIGADGFIHHYLIRAIENEGSNESWSNSVHMEFTHPITVPNVFTPNGDGFNQYFFIPKIELYQDAELRVIDRWGKSVYKANGYKNDWDGDDLSTGVYYYVLDLKKRNTVIKGIVNIVK